MRRLIFLCLVVESLLPAQTIPVPSNYQDLYSLLTTQISAFDTTVKASWNGKRSGVAYAPQLLTASSTEYTELLQPYHYSNLVLVELTELQALGSTAITVHIDFPILYQPFYASNPSLYQQFVSFYQQLALDVHARGMKLVVETGVGMVFPGDNAAAYTTYLQGLSWDAYMAGRAQNAVNIAQSIQADYMSVITEPDTEAGTSYQTNAGTLTGSTQLLQTILAALAGAGPISVKIGAGAGTWIASFDQYLQNFAATSVDYIDMHVYPVNNSDLTNLLSAATLMHTAGKPIAMSEAWAYKVRNTELGTMTPTQIYARDPFSFWQPVDSAFLGAIADFANYQKLLFIAPFWSHYFGAYLDYNEYGSLADSAILNDAYNAAIAANLIGEFTQTGVSWRNSAVPKADLTPPMVPAAPMTTYVSPTSLQLAWTQPSDNVGVAAYNLYRNGALLTTTSMTNFLDTNLVPGETYLYSMSAFDASGNTSGESAPIAVETTDTTPPTIPANLQATSVQSRSVSIEWSASTGIGGVGGYIVFRGTSAQSLTAIATTTATTYTVASAPSTTYYFAVESFNPLRIASAQSKVLPVTTPAQ